MSTLPSSMPPGTYTPLPYGDNFGMNQPRLSQLQTLEAKMASIAVSLSGGRRLAGSLPHTQAHASLRSSPSLVDMVKSKTSSAQRLPKQIRSENELLRKIIHDKDAIIQSFQQQQEQQQQSSTMSSVLNHVNGNNSRTSVNERQQVERRLSIINHDIDAKKAAIKNIRLLLQQTSVTDNIDSRIRQAETEYQLEREETNLLNLQDEKRTLLLRWGGNQWQRDPTPSNSNHSLFRIIQGRVPLVVISTTVQYEAQNPSFRLHFEDNQNHDSCLTLETCSIQWARDDLVLKSGDKLVEINGQLIPGQFKADVMKGLHSGLMEIVVARQSHEDAYQTQIRDLTSRIERLNQEHSSLKGDNMRLSHRISYLEDIREDMEMRREAEKLSAVQSQSYVHSQPAPSVVPVRQKPPRNSKLQHKLRSSSLNNNQVSDHTGSLDSRRIAGSVGGETSLNESAQPGYSSVSRIKTSSIVDRHFGHVIRVTHHHHPTHEQKWPRRVDSVSDIQSVASFDSFSDRYPVAPSVTSVDKMPSVSLVTKQFNQLRPSSPTRSDVQSIASMDIDRRCSHLGYISDGQTISSNYSDSLTKKPKPVPPRKPSFLYLNRTSSLQSVNDSKVRSQSSTDEYKSNSNTSGKIGKSNLTHNLKWSILSSSRSKNGEMKKNAKERETDA